MERVLVLGAGGGIGSVLCRLLEERRVETLRVFHARDSGEDHAWAVEARRAGEVDRLVRRAAEEAPIDAVVNLIGSLELKNPARVTDQEILETLQVHLLSCFEIVRAATKVMKSGSALVFMSSAAAQIGLPNHEAIAAAKAGVEGLSRAAAATLGPRGIRVNAVAPGLVRTPLSASLTEVPAVRKASEAMHVLGRIGEPEDIARAIDFVLQSPWMTGEVLRVDGGLSQVRSPRGG